MAGQVYKKQQQQQQQQGTKDRYIHALKSALVYFEKTNTKLTDDLLVQTKLVKNNQASNFATMLQKLRGLEAQAASLHVPVP